MKALIVIYTVAALSGLTAVGYVNNVINDLAVKPASHSHQLVTVYQEQGGNRETIQVTVPNAPQQAKASVQGNQEDGDNLQPALGYGALNWNMQ